MSELKRFFNPFRDVIGNQYARHAFTLNSTPKDKLIAAFYAIWGGLGDIGILDYATLFIVPLLSELTGACFKALENEQTPILVKVVVAPVGAISFIAALAIKLALGAVAIALTVATSFITAIVHGVSLLAKNALLKQARELEFEQAPTSSHATITTTLDSQETPANVKLGALIDADPENVWTRIMVKNNTDNVREVQLRSYDASTGEFVSTRFFPLNEITSSPQSPQAKALAAVVKLDLGHSANNLESEIYGDLQPGHAYI